MNTRRMPFAAGVSLALAASIFALCPAGARADERAPAVPLHPAYRAECASCHIAYPPGMLPAASWKRLMSDLPNHYGSDASIDDKTLGELTRWLEAHAGTHKRLRGDATAPPEDRITRSRWFVREHDEIPAATWKRAAIGSAANCAACHTKADQGEFRERDIRIPR